MLYWLQQDKNSFFDSIWVELLGQLLKSDCSSLFFFFSSTFILTMQSLLVEEMIKWSFKKNGVFHLNLTLIFSHDFKPLLELSHAPSRWWCPFPSGMRIAVKRSAANLIIKQSASRLFPSSVSARFHFWRKERGFLCTTKTIWSHFPSW